MGDQVQWKDASAITAAIKDVLRPNVFSGWVLVGYEKDNVLVLQGKGSGGVSEVAKHLRDDEVQYILVRIPEKKDIANATRDIFITWWGPKHPKIKSAKKRTHHADVKKVMQPSHAELECINKANFTEDVVRERSNPGSGSHVID